MAGLAGVVGFLGPATNPQLFAQETPTLPPEALLGTWDFDDPTLSGRSADRMQGTLIEFTGNATFSADGAGRSGAPGDRALDFGVAGGSSARITDAEFMGTLNWNNAATDRLTVVFWQRWATATVNNSSTVWFVSPSAGAGDRGFHAHLPWGSGSSIGSGTVYFDTSGCCSTPTQRLSADIATVFPGFDWGQWHHVALIKNGGAKQIWINGQLFLGQTTGALPLLSDWTEVVLGQVATEPQHVLRGLVDDFAVFATALDGAQIAALAAGKTPADLVLPADQWPPVFSGLQPAEGDRFHPVDGGIRFTVSTASPNTIDPADITLVLNGADVSNALLIGGEPTRREVTYADTLEADRVHSAHAVAADNTGRSSVRTWTFDTYDPTSVLAHPQLQLAGLGLATQSGDPASPGPAHRAIDGDSATFSETTDAPDSFWELELTRAVALTRIELVPPPGAAYAGVLEGLVLRVSDLRDQVLFETTVSGVAGGGVWSLLLPEVIRGRIIRLGLDGGQVNGAGDRRVTLAEVRLFGDPSPFYGPLALGEVATAVQSSTALSANAAVAAIDGNPGTFSQTEDLPEGYWRLVLDRTRPIRRIELVNRLSNTYAARMEGLTLRILDDQSHTVTSTRVSNPGAGGTWVYEPPPGTVGRQLWVGLEHGAVNGFGDGVISLAQVNVSTADNYALGAESYMIRFLDNLPPASAANDGNYATFAETTDKTVDGYWETDLGETRALYSVRVVALDGGVNQVRLSRATVRLYDADHRSVFAQRLEGTSATFEVRLPGPVLARYVRVGFENKQRSHPAGDIEWWLRIREVQAFGRPAEEVGLLEFTAAPTRLTAGDTAQLQWRQADLYRLDLYPGVGSVGATVDPAGVGQLTVTPDASIQYVLVGSNVNGNFVRHWTLEVDGQRLPARISEFVASNRLSLRDGSQAEPDWIELHNPNNDPLDLTGYGLSDNPARPMKWVFPAVTIPPHGYLIVFASGREEAFDEAGFLHAGFSLSAAGESVVLTAPDGVTVVDAVLDYPPQRQDLAYGRTLEGAWAFLEPTPGGPNLATAYAGWLEPVTFSHERGFRSEPFSLEIRNPNPDGQVFYSLDGTEPSLPYAGPIPVTENRTVRATVRQAGFQSPRVQTHTYLFLDQTMASPLMDRRIADDPRYRDRLRKGLTDLPTIALGVPAIPDPANPSTEYNEREGSIEIFWPDGTPSVQENCGVYRAGGAWTLFDKRGYRLKFRARYGARKLQAPLFDGFDRGFPVHDRFDTLDLRGGNHDMVSRGFYLGARFSEDTMLDMGSLNPHGRFVHLYLNGVYWGQYHLRERLVDAFLADYLGGQTADYVNIRGNDNSSAGFIPGTPDPPHRAPWDFVLAHRRSYTALQDRIDLQHLIDFMLMWNYGNAEQEFRAAGPIDPGSGFKFWLGDGDGYLRTSALTLNRTGDGGPAGIFGALTAERHPDFMMLLADRIYRHFFHEGALTPARNEARLNERMDEIADSLVAECARWGYRTPENWAAAAETIRTDLFPYRTANLFTMLRQRGLYPAINPPQFNQHGGTVPYGFELTLTAGPGSVYYTLDGSDPRLPGGGIAPQALLWHDPDLVLMLEDATWIKARLFGAGTWSALAEARFLPAQLDPPTLEWTASGTDGHPQFWFRTSPGGTYEVEYSPESVPSDWHPWLRFEDTPGGLQPLPDFPEADHAAVFLRVLRLR
jgi:hypothetical protein